MKVFLSIAVPLSVFSLSCESAALRESLWCHFPLCRLFLPVSCWWPVWWCDTRIPCFPCHASSLRQVLFLEFQGWGFFQHSFPVSCGGQTLPHTLVRILCPSSSVRRSLKLLLWDHNPWTASDSSLIGRFFIHLTFPYLNFTSGKADFTAPPQWLMFFIFRKLGVGDVELRAFS